MIHIIRSIQWSKLEVKKSKGEEQDLLQAVGLEDLSRAVGYPSVDDGLLILCNAIV